MGLSLPPRRGRTGSTAGRANHEHPASISPPGPRNVARLSPSPVRNMAHGGLRAKPPVAGSIDPGNPHVSGLGTRPLPSEPADRPFQPRDDAGTLGPPPRPRHPRRVRSPHGGLDWPPPETARDPVPLELREHLDPRLDRPTMGAVRGAEGRTVGGRRDCF